MALITFKSESFKRFAQEGVWVLLGQVTTVVASLVLVRVLTGHLDPAQYGQLALALTLGTLVGQVAFSGVMPGLMRYYTVAKEHDEIKKYLLVCLRLVGYGTAAAIGLSTLLLMGLSVVNKANMTALTCFAIIFTLLVSYSSALNTIQNAARQRKVVAVHSSLDAWLRVLFAVWFLAWLGGSAVVVITAYIASLLLVLSLQIMFIKRLIPSQQKNEKKANLWATQIWQYSKPFVYINAFTWIQASSDRWALDTFASPQDVGLYAALFQLGYTPVMTISGLMITLVGPIFFEQSGDGMDSVKNTEMHRAVWQIVGVSLLTTFLVSFFGYLFHGWIFEILVAPQYHSVSYLLPWVILAGGIFSAGQVLSLKLMSDMNTQALIWPKIVTSLVAALLSFYGAYVEGLTGVVYAGVIFSVAHLGWLSWLSWHPLEL